MRKLKSYEIRQMWLDFFKEKGHDVVPSASLVPVNDPTLLWINAGVAPLKKYFDGREIPKNRRMVNAQKSIRTNDIENVGKTARHHTFFEMLGNFSIGDYFRNEVLPWAIEILTSEKWFGFDINKLYFTIYPDDVESYNLWVSLGVDPNHIIKLEDNFWEIGEGPCGPDTEIFYDRGEKYDPQGLGIKMLKEDIENDRYIEIWNIVFSQFNAKADTPRSEYKELPNKNIDTGMGLERIACVMQEVETNYDTDLFMPVINEVEKITGVKYEGQMAFKVIADHVRSVTFAVSDGAMLSNEGRGYVLRRILRRAVRYGKKLGMNKPFMYKLVHVVSEYMSNFYPYLLETADNVSKVIKLEEEKFLATLETGEKKLVDYMASATQKVVPGDIAFLLYDTFGFPFELTLEVAEENGFTVDENGFKAELNRQKELSRSSRNEEQSMNSQNVDMLEFKIACEFLGYNSTELEGKVVAIFENGKRVSETTSNAIIVFDKTPFYAESGGQIGDKGKLVINGETIKVTNTNKLPNLQHGLFTENNGTLIKVNDTVLQVVDKELRKQVTLNHSATHLLNEALRQVLGNHLHQQGSNVNETSLRFDFNNFTLPTLEELLKVEELVNLEIEKASESNINEMKLDEAKNKGVQAVFGEKYGDIVRVVEIGFSKELCGGTHVTNTKDIEKFAILSVESKGSGIFRIEAATSNNIASEISRVTESLNEEINDLLRRKAELINTAKKEGIELEDSNFKMSDLVESYKCVINRRKEVEVLRDEVKELDKKYNRIKREKNTLSLDDYLTKFEEINGVNVLIAEIKNAEINGVKDLADRLADKVGVSVIFMAIKMVDKVIFICKNKVSGLNAGALVKEAAIITSGNGGGRPDFAQAGGKDVTKVSEAIETIKERIKAAL